MNLVPTGDAVELRGHTLVLPGCGVGLLSGKTATVEVGLEEQVETLTHRACTALGVGRGRLVDSSGSVLDTRALIRNTRVQESELLTLHVNQVQICATTAAFAAILGDGSVATWGQAAFGGNSSAVQTQLKNVRKIQATDAAFAAILDDGSVVTWGDVDAGGDSNAVQDQLKNVLQIQASASAFAAIRVDGSVVTWGFAGAGGDSGAVQAQLQNVQKIQASHSAFAAILGNGSVVTWGSIRGGAASITVQAELKNVQQIQVCNCPFGTAFAAILGDGSVVAWGFAGAPGDSSHSSPVQDQLKNVRHIQASGYSFAALLVDGSVVTWGAAGSGGDCSAVKDQLQNVQQIQACQSAFSALLGDGTVVTWGDAILGGDSGPVTAQLKGAQQIQSNDRACAAILRDGSVVTWGDGRGGDSSAVTDQLKNVQQIQAGRFAFAAILGDGSVVTWGEAGAGGDSSAVQDQLKNVQQIQANDHAFAAILGNGSVVTWGRASLGGDSGIAHLGELAVDALISSFDLQRVAIVQHRHILPVAMANAFEGKVPAITTAAELYQASSRPMLSMLQLRSGAAEGKRQTLAKELLRWAQDAGVSQILILAPCSAHVKRDADLRAASQLRVLASPASDLPAQLLPLGHEMSEVELAGLPGSAAAARALLRGSGLARPLIEAAAEPHSPSFSPPSRVAPSVCCICGFTNETLDWRLPEEMVKAVSGYLGPRLGMDCARPLLPPPSWQLAQKVQMQPPMENLIHPGLENLPGAVLKVASVEAATAQQELQSALGEIMLQHWLISRHLNPRAVLQLNQGCGGQVSEEHLQVRAALIDVLCVILPTGNAAILAQRLPGLVESVLESRHAEVRGFDLHDAAFVVAAVERLIFDEAHGQTPQKSLGETEMQQVVEDYLVRWLMGDDEEGSITRSFASFWQSECTGLKESLVAMDPFHTGRVPLSKFYGTGGFTSAIRQKQHCPASLNRSGDRPEARLFEEEVGECLKEAFGKDWVDKPPFRKIDRVTTECHEAQHRHKEPTSRTSNPDYKVTIKGDRYVIDAKYHSKSHVSTDDVSKIWSDMKSHGASKGVLVVNHGHCLNNVSATLERTAQDHHVIVLRFSSRAQLVSDLKALPPPDKSTGRLDQSGLDRAITSTASTTLLATKASGATATKSNIMLATKAGAAAAKTKGLLATKAGLTKAGCATAAFSPVAAVIIGVVVLGVIACAAWYFWGR
ncbi:Proteasome assembly chaperone 2 [Symbiodinium microadriaticum]|uniref:Proteasome assembly chaperone 2 n=1 Tax=Symbiodinium microadriaticum TaxID=2951 RepID=A0A1Q9E3L3_SYMMI|nr:Proteasome assembly chaperone 2 [Symbiodinium microadriaticum]